MLGLGGCRLYPFLDISCSPAGSQIPGAVTGACWDMMAILELTLTQACGDQAVPSRAVLRWQRRGQPSG